jgi:hypothetical protein
MNDVPRLRGSRRGCFGLRRSDKVTSGQSNCETKQGLNSQFAKLIKFIHVVLLCIGFDAASLTAISISDYISTGIYQQAVESAVFLQCIRFHEKTMRNCMPVFT